MVSRSGVCGTAADAWDRTDDWTRLEVVLASGDDLSVGYAAEPGPDGAITAVTAYLSPSFAHADLVTSSSSSIGGFHDEVDVHDAVRHAVMHVAASDTFYEQFPDAPGLALTFIGEQSGYDGGFRYANTPRPQESGARFTLDDELDVVVTTRDGRVELVVDDVTLDDRNPSLLALVCTPVNQHLGLTPAAGQTPAEALGQMVSGVIDKARSRPFWVANIDETKAGLL